jgi:hypothetical protein
MTQIEIDHDRTYSCPRCGADVTGAALFKRQWRGDFRRECRDCLAVPAQLEGKCRPWSGDIDLNTMQPLKDGKPYMVGERTCGHLDCVAKAHVIIPAEPKKKVYRPNAVGWSFEEAYAQVMAQQFASRANA